MNGQLQFMLFSEQEHEVRFRKIPNATSPDRQMANYAASKTWFTDGVGWSLPRQLWFRLRSGAMALKLHSWLHEDSRVWHPLANAYLEANVPLESIIYLQPRVHAEYTLVTWWAELGQLEKEVAGRGWNCDGTPGLTSYGLGKT